MNLDALKAEFPREAVSWRAQKVTTDGTKAMALAYIDARDVMRRLDEVCGPDWQDEYVETPKGRVICRIGLYLTDPDFGIPRWVWRSDGAGDTDVEGDKGAISDAFKRAAVKWGIGRYLYDMPAPWVPCEAVGGKWRKWTADPWDFVKAPQRLATPVQKPHPLPHDIEPSLPEFIAQCRGQHGGGDGFLEYVSKTFNAGWKRCKTPKQMENAWTKHKPSIEWLRDQSAAEFGHVVDGFELHMQELTGNFERAAE